MFSASLGVRLGVCADVRFLVFTVAILAQGTNRGDALCAALLRNRTVSILLATSFCFYFANVGEMGFVVFIFSDNTSRSIIELLIVFLSVSAFASF